MQRNKLGSANCSCARAHTRTHAHARTHTRTKNVLRQTIFTRKINKQTNSKEPTPLLTFFSGDMSGSVFGDSQ